MPSLSKAVSKKLYGVIDRIAMLRRRRERRVTKPYKAKPAKRAHFAVCRVQMDT
jgi:hypothetical protein